MAHATAPLSAVAANATPAPPGAETAAATPGEGEAPLDSFLLLRDHVRELFAFNKTSLAGHAIGAIIIEMIFSGVAPQSLRVVWGTGFAIVWLLRAWLAVRFAQREPRSMAGMERRLRAWQARRARLGCALGHRRLVLLGVRQRPAPGRPRPRRLHLLRRVGADPRAAIPPVRAVRLRDLRARDRPRRPRRQRARLAARRGDDSGDGHDDAARPQLPRRVRARRRPQAAQRGARRSAARREGGGRCGAPRGRGRQPRQDAVLHRRQPRPAPAAARHGPVRRGLARACARPRGRAARQQHQRIGRRARGPVLRAARHQPHRQRRRRGESREFRARRHLPQGAAALRAGGVREGAGAAHPRRQACRARRSAAGRAHRPQPGLERDPLHPGRLGSAQLPAPRRAAAAPGLGHRPGHPRRRARPHLRGVLPGAGRGGGHGRAEEGPRPRPGDRQAAVRIDGGPARPALAGRPRLGLHASSCRSARGRARRRGRSRARGRSASPSTAA